jgi:hypothetical protein
MGENAGRLGSLSLAFRFLFMFTLRAAANGCKTTPVFSVLLYP